MIRFQFSKILFVRIVYTLVVMLNFFLMPFAHSQEKPDYYLKEIVVTANRFPDNLTDINRSVTIIGSDQIAKSTAKSVEELLEYVAGVDVRQRGSFGVQADVSIRGSSSEQTLILIDGIKVNDPQTGHHNLNLPVSLYDIEKIEMLRGQGSRLYGPNAFGGVINIITKKGNTKNNNLSLSVGDFGFLMGSGSFSIPYRFGGSKISIAHKKSNGYHSNTDFKISTVYCTNVFNLASAKSDISFGYLNKEYGAYAFYSDIYPNEWEKINTTFVNFSSSIRKSKYAVFPKIYWRRNFDDFVLDRDKPDWYRNEHTTDVYGGEIHFNMISQFGTTAVGAEVTRETINSTNLGNHQRSNFGFYFEHKSVFKKITFVPGASSYYYSNWGWKIYPGFDVGYQITTGLRLYGSAGHSFRVPNFTELYYSSPANQGNVNLKPEQAWSYEAGLNWSKEWLNGKITLFQRNGEQLIDWVRDSPEMVWQSRNIANVNTNGVEIAIDLKTDIGGKNFALSQIRSSYVFLNSNREKSSLESKYILNYLRHKLLLNIEINAFNNIYQNFSCRYEDRVSYKDLFLLDSKTSWKFRKINFFLELTNILDTTYVEAGFVPMPGRWAMLGFELNFNN